MNLVMKANDNNDNNKTNLGAYSLQTQKAKTNYNRKDQQKQGQKNKELLPKFKIIRREK